MENQSKFAGNGVAKVTDELPPSQKGHEGLSLGANVAEHRWQKMSSGGIFTVRLSKWQRLGFGENRRFPEPSGMAGFAGISKNL